MKDKACNPCNGIYIYTPNIIKLVSIHTNKLVFQYQDIEAKFKFWFESFFEGKPVEERIPVDNYLVLIS